MAGLGGGSGCASPSAGGRDSRQQQTAAAAGDAGTRPSGRDRRAESSPAGGLRRGAASRPGTQTGWPGGRAEVIGTDCRILLWGVGRAGVIFDDAEKGASVVPKNAKRKKRRRVHGRVRRGRRRLFRPAVRIEGATGWAGLGVCVCVYCRQMEELRGRVFTSWVPGLEDGMFGGERQPARTGTGARRMSWVWSVRLSLFCAASFIPAPFPWIPASVSNFLPHQSPRALGATLFSPSQRLFDLLPTDMKRARLVPLSAVLSGQTKSTLTQLTRHPTCFHSQRAVHRHPCHRQVRGKKGARGQEEGAAGLAGWAGGLLTLPSSWTWWGCPVSIADGSGQDLLLSSQLFAFPPPPQRCLGSSDIISSLSPLPQHFCGGCTMLCHAESAPCLPTAYWPDIVTGHSTVSGSADADTASRLNSAIPSLFPLSCRFSRADSVGQQDGIKIGPGRPVSDPPTAMTQRIGSGPITMPRLGRNPGGGAAARHAGLHLQPRSYSGPPELPFRSWLSREASGADPGRVCLTVAGPDQADGVVLETTWWRAV